MTTRIGIDGPLFVKETYFIVNYRDAIRDTAAAHSNVEFHLFDRPGVGRYAYDYIDDIRTDDSISIVVYTLLPAPEVPEYVIPAKLQSGRHRLQYCNDEIDRMDQWNGAIQRVIHVWPILQSVQYLFQGTRTFNDQTLNDRIPVDHAFAVVEDMTQSTRMVSDSILEKIAEWMHEEHMAVLERKMPHLHKKFEEKSAIQVEKPLPSPVPRKRRHMHKSTANFNRLTLDSPPSPQSGTTASTALPKQKKHMTGSANEFQRTRPLHTRKRNRNGDVSLDKTDDEEEVDEEPTSEDHAFVANDASPSVDDDNDTDESFREQSSSSESINDDNDDNSNREESNQDDDDDEQPKKKRSVDSEISSAVVSAIPVLDIKETLRSRRAKLDAKPTEFIQDSDVCWAFHDAAPWHEEMRDCRWQGRLTKSECEAFYHMLTIRRSRWPETEFYRKHITKVIAMINTIGKDNAFMVKRRRDFFHLAAMSRMTIVEEPEEFLSYEPRPCFATDNCPHVRSVDSLYIYGGPSMTRYEKARFKSIPAGAFGSRLEPQARADYTIGSTCSCRLHWCIGAMWVLNEASKVYDDEAESGDDSPEAAWVETHLRGFLGIFAKAGKAFGTHDDEHE